LLERHGVFSRYCFLADRTNGRA